MNDYSCHIALDYPLRDVVLARHLDFLDKLAKRSPNKCKHAAALLGPRLDIICYGYNRHTLHAEEDAVTKWVRAYRPRGRMAKYLVVIRSNAEGLVASKPCKRCYLLACTYDLEVVHS